MYYLLNYAPSVLYITISLKSIKIDFGVFAIAYLFAQPLYLLIVNVPFICKKSISYASSLTYMVSVIIFNVLYTIIAHKIKTGYFADDVPISIYFCMLCIPMMIVVFGIGILYSFKKN